MTEKWMLALLPFGLALIGYMWMPEVNKIKAMDWLNERDSPAAHITAGAVQQTLDFSAWFQTNGWMIDIGALSVLFVLGVAATLAALFLDW